VVERSDTTGWSHPRFLSLDAGGIAAGFVSEDAFPVLAVANHLLTQLSPMEFLMEH